MFDEYLMDNLIGFLTELSTSQVRAFRHTVTFSCLFTSFFSSISSISFLFSAMKLMTSLVIVFKQLNNNTNNFQKQLDAENKKSRPNQALERLDILRNKLQEVRMKL